MKKQTQHNDKFLYRGGISHVFDYSPFGAPLDGRTIEQTLYQEVTTSTTTYTTEYALEEHFDSSPNWTPLTASSQVSYPSQVMRVKNTQTTKKTIGATESFTTGDGVHSLSFKSIVIPKDLCQAIIIKNSLATPQFNQNLYLQVIIRNQNGVVVATDSINVTGNYPDFLNFTATSGYTYSVEFVMRSVCRSNAVNNYFEVDDVLISYEEATTEEHTEFVASGSYLWGFNTQQRVDEIAGKGNHYTAEFWEYSPRLGKRWNIDPVVKPHESPYAAFANNPIIFVDPNGDDVINGDRLVANQKEADKRKADNSLSDFKTHHNISDNSTRKDFLSQGGTKKEWKEYKKLKTEVKKATKQFNSWDERAKITQNIIDQWKISSPNLFNKVDKQSTNFILSSFNYNSSIHDAFGSTTPAYSGDAMDAKAPPSMKVRIAQQVNLVSPDVETGQYSLNHEAGHFLYIVKYTAEYVKYYIEGKKNGTYVKGGHGKTDESGKVATEYGKVKDIPSPAPTILPTGN
ncbi:MAG: hypothetical protein H3C31_12620 [Brumimicrobium sp.]|nr:hypothetical protein [Brumimicrobium sp.]